MAGGCWDHYIHDATGIGPQRPRGRSCTPKEHYTIGAGRSSGQVDGCSTGTGMVVTVSGFLDPELMGLHLTGGFGLRGGGKSIVYEKCG